MQILPGTKVSVIWGAINDLESRPVLYVLGEGVYDGDVVPSLENGSGYRAGIDYLTPKINLQDGNTIYGCECYWGGHDEMEKMIRVHEALGQRVERVTFAQAIEISKAAKDSGPIPEVNNTIRKGFVTTVIVTAGKPLAAETVFMGTLFIATHEIGRTEAEIIETVRSAVQEFLCTPEGKQAHEDACSGFCWWDLPPYLEDIKGYFPSWLVNVRHLDPDQMAYTDQNIAFA